MRSTGRCFAYGAGLAVAAYATYVGYTWLRYGHVTRGTSEERDALLDQLMPAYEVVERHDVRVGAPAEITFATAYEMDLQEAAVVRAIFRAREWIMRSQTTRTPKQRGFIDQMREVGWGVLGEIPGHEIVLGGVTQPWKANPTFRAMSPDEFVTAREPGHVKIVWTLRADSITPSESVFRTETRVATTDRAARAKFRWYWSLVSPGVILIRWAMLGPLKAKAEHRWREVRLQTAHIDNSYEEVCGKPADEKSHVS